MSFGQSTAQGFQNPAEVIAQIVIIEGDSGGLFIYNGAGSFGNPPILAAVAPGVTEDPFGNPVETLLNIGNISGAHVGFDTTGDIFLANSSGETTIYLNPALGLVGFYPSGFALNNLGISIASASGDDQFGNPFPQGFQSIVPGGGLFVQVNEGVITFGDTESPDPLTYNGLLRIIHMAAHDDTPILAMDSPAADTAETHTSFWLLGNSILGGTALVQAALFGYTSADVEIPAELIMCGTMPFGSIVGGVPTAETWHDLAPTLAGWAQTAGAYPLQYRKLASPPNSVQVQGSVTGGALAAGTISLATLPAGYFPATLPTPAMPIYASTAVAATVPNLVVTDTGVMQIRNAQGSTNLQFDVIYSLDGNTS